MQLRLNAKSVVGQNDGDSNINDENSSSNVNASYFNIYNDEVNVEDVNTN